MPTQATIPPPDAHTPTAENEKILALVRRLSRPHASGGDVIERAAILAEGADSAAILTWIAACGGEAEFPGVPERGGGGLHAERRSRAAGARQALRYVLPAGALSSGPR